MVRSVALAAVVLVATVALGYGAAALMKGSSREDDPCIGCGLVVIGSVGLGITAAVVVLVLGWSRRRTPR